MWQLLGSGETRASSCAPQETRRRPRSGGVGVCGAEAEGKGEWRGEESGGGETSQLLLSLSLSALGQD